MCYHGSMLSDNDLKKVEEIVDRKLDEKLDEKFDEKMEPWVERFMQVFATKQEVEDIVDRKIAPLYEIVKKTYEAVESLVSGKETEKFENAARDAQLTRHDGWIKQVATETKVKLKD